MRKTDESIQKICIASIKRKVIKPINYPLSKMFEAEDWLTHDNAAYHHIERIQNELPIAQTFVDDMNWSLVTTLRVISKVEGLVVQGFLHQIREWTWSDFKGIIKKEKVTRGSVMLEDGTSINILIETGAASMIMIYGIRTATQLNNGSA